MLRLNRSVVFILVASCIVASVSFPFFHSFMLNLKLTLEKQVKCYLKIKLTGMCAAVGGGLKLGERFSVRLLCIQTLHKKEILLIHMGLLVVQES